MGVCCGTNQTDKDHADILSPSENVLGTNILSKQISDEPLVRELQCPINCQSIKSKCFSGCDSSFINIADNADILLSRRTQFMEQIYKCCEIYYDLCIPNQILHEIFRLVHDPSKLQMNDEKLYIPSYTCCRECYQYYLDNNMNRVCKQWMTEINNIDTTSNDHNISNSNGNSNTIQMDVDILLYSEQRWYSQEIVLRLTKNEYLGYYKSDNSDTSSYTRWYHKEQKQTTQSSRWKFNKPQRNKKNGKQTGQGNTNNNNINQNMDQVSIKTIFTIDQVNPLQLKDDWRKYYNNPRHSKELKHLYSKRVIIYVYDVRDRNSFKFDKFYEFMMDLRDHESVEHLVKKNSINSSSNQTLKVNETEHENDEKKSESPLQSSIYLMSGLSDLKLDKPKSIWDINPNVALILCASGCDEKNASEPLSKPKCVVKRVSDGNSGHDNNDAKEVSINGDDNGGSVNIVFADDGDENDNGDGNGNGSDSDDDVVTEKKSSRREISTEEGMEMGGKHNVPSIEVSPCVDGFNITKLFDLAMLEYWFTDCVDKCPYRSKQMAQLLHFNTFVSARSILRQSSFDVSADPFDQL